MNSKLSQLSAPVLAVLVGAAAAPQVEAQEPPTQAPDLKKLSKFEGTWAAEGTYSVPEGDGEWGGVLDCRWILDGFAMEARQTIGFEIPEGALQVLASTVMGHDPATDTLKFYDFANDGKPGTIGTADWVDSSTLVSVITSRGAKGTTIRRSTWRFAGDSMEFVHEVMDGAEPFHTEVTGTFTKVEEDVEWPTETRFQFGGPVRPEMSKLKPFLGDWETAGWMVMPGFGKMPLTGTEQVHKRMGGHIVEFTTTGIAEGDPNEYHARTFVEWNPMTESYQMVSFSNMGEFTHCEMNWTDDSSLTNFISSEWLGQSMLSRGVMKVSDDKVTVDTHAIFGMEDPLHMFHIDYTRADD
ncbi:MAG: hypothetical protein AAF196_07220 [Planctomycetota bacterium]